MQWMALRLEAAQKAGCEALLLDEALRDYIARRKAALNCATQISPASVYWPV